MHYVLYFLSAIMKLFMYDFIDEFMNGLCMTYEYMTYALSVLSI